MSVVTMHPTECYCKDCTGIDTTKEKTSVPKAPVRKRQQTLQEAAKNTKQTKLTDFGARPARYSNKQYPERNLRQQTLQEGN